MIRKDYTQEVGIPSAKKTMPRPLAYAVLAIVAVGVSFGVRAVVRESKAHHASEKQASAAAAAPAPTAPADTAPAAAAKAPGSQ
jgi:hypothetical protein